jgi:hypothetical protein
MLGIELARTGAGEGRERNGHREKRRPIKA